jgi:hypothetical protein
MCETTVKTMVRGVTKNSVSIKVQPLIHPETSILSMSIGSMETVHLSEVHESRHCNKPALERVLTCVVFLDCCVKHLSRQW